MTIDEIFFEAAKKGLSSKRWGSSRLLTYNGFTHEQRVRKWQALDLAVRMGLEIPAEQFPCSVCGASPSPSIAYHSEDYGTMNGHYPVCRSCHMKIHNRLKNPERWAAFIAVMGNGEKWFEKLKDVHGSKPISGTILSKNLRSIKKTVEEKITMTSTAGGPIGGKATVKHEMHAVRVAFVKAMGIKEKKMNPNPVGGYKLEHNSAIRETNLTEARRLRNEYAQMVKKNGVGQVILDKMDSNLANRDRNAEWR